jgi:two-component system, chemotaxis family, response regulator PixG
LSALTIPSSSVMNNDLHYLTAVDPQRNIVSRFQYLSWGEFTGSLMVTVESGQSWEMLLYQGQIVWCIDRQRPNRQWQRLIRAHVGYKHIGIELLLQAAEHFQSKGSEVFSQNCWQYQGAIALMMLSEIKPPELTTMLTVAAEETIFDLLQYSQGQPLTFRSQPEVFAEQPRILLNTEAVLARAEGMWQEWDKQKLGNISPNKTPAIKHPVQLYRQTTPIIYQNLVQVITGKQTLREIAVEINEDLLLLTRSLTRYLQTGIIESIDLPDLPSPAISSKSASPARRKRNNPSSSPSKAAVSSKLAICIDDNSQVCEIMRAIVTEAGYRFISIQDATQALPRLLENKPDLIFLDLIMPKINGYEICGQIRRISSFTDIPIVILTDRDGLLDRVRSKVVGASEFISKPITRNSIEVALDKYLGTLVRK